MSEKKKICCILETSGSPHEDGLQSLVETLKTLDYRVILFLSKVNADRSEKLDINKCADEILIYENWQVLFGIVKLFKKYDLMILHTVSVRNTLPLFLITLICNIPYVIFIRNINSWYKYTWHKSTLMNIIARNISTLLKKIMLARCASIIVENERLKETLLKNGQLKIDVVPFKKIKGIRKNYGDDRINIINLIVPGVIDFKKKDLETILTAFAQLKKEEIRKLKLIFLGKVKNSEDSMMCSRYKEILGDAFDYYTKFIEPRLFEKIMDEANVVIGSYFPHHVCEHFNEIYGQTKGSAVDAQAISRAIPLFVNSCFEPDQQYKKSTVIFEGVQQLNKLFERLVYDPEFLNELCISANVESSYFSTSSVASKIKHF